jgi:uncharacterized protein (TIGR00297 family)
VNPDFLIVALLVVGASLVVVMKKLTPLAGFTGLAIAIIIYFGSGYAGLVCLGAFFICGVWATGWKQDEKALRGISEENKGRRKASQVIANSGMAALVSLAGNWWGTDPYFITILIGAAFSAATADTLSSELGNIYGKRHYNILTFKRDQRGLDGVISFEGSVAGIAGSFLIAMIAFAFYPVIESFAIVLIAGTAGNFADSVLGAAFERRRKMGNDTVNFLNTVVGVIVAYALILSALFS